MAAIQSLQPFVLPVRVEEIPAIDLDHFLGFIGPEREGFLLESGLEAAGTGHWHFCGLDPIGRFQATREHWQSKALDGSVFGGEEDPLAALESWWSGWSFDHDPKLAESLDLPFVGGAVGWIGYEAADAFLGLPLRKGPEGPIGELLSGVPEMNWRLYDELVAIDARDGRSWFLHRGREGWKERRWWLSTPWQKNSYTQRSTPKRESIRAGQCAPRITETSLTDEEYLACVEETRQRIGVGDVYEVNVARGLLLDDVPAAADLHRLWRQAQPVPYGAFIQGDPVSVVSASPEQFLSRRGDLISTRPIKGTVPREATAALDSAAAQRLLRNEKERAELAMIVDLERNDLGRICQPGSVAVTAAAEVEKYASVLHTVATVEGRLRGNPGPGEILRATFPGGSITGAPKIAAMEQIRQLEPWP
ncbi:MAG: anthranilate synthase component I family protein, partial [Planctomycetota bacterium]